MYSRDEVIKDLRAGVLEIRFTKADGSTRIMKCSLSEKFLPPSFQNLDEQEQEKTFHKTNPEVVACWDVENVGWRSFRMDSIQYIQFLDAY